MATIYEYAKIIHLFCAIIFLGYVFFDVVIFGRLKGILGTDFERVKQIITSKTIKIMPICVFLLVLTGGMMMSTWVGSKAGGYWQTPTQQVFMIKVILAFIIVCGVIFSLSCRALGKTPPAFIKQNLHSIVLVLGFFIVLFAKLMFMV
ncbi:copper resistance protein CopD [Campylobacter sp. faydin G-105]|uniref:copper resistance protein CopD n=1 Tax=Campylobacter anatolicus TaxID=2829105 RepID=UPI001B970BB6|nr:copper resistance protein CopD [Campylobacter anatolicus]MBR8461364.1 copper resistance protein CopD [Campylobacter anatolicus]